MRALYTVPIFYMFLAVLLTMTLPGQSTPFTPLGDNVRLRSDQGELGQIINTSDPTQLTGSFRDEFYNSSTQSGLLGELTQSTTTLRYVYAVLRTVVQMITLQLDIPGDPGASMVINSLIMLPLNFILAIGVLIALRGGGAT